MSDNLNASETREKIGFLYSNYEHGYFYWEFVVIARLMCFALISVMFADRPVAQAGLGL